MTYDDKIDAMRQDECQEIKDCGTFHALEHALHDIEQDKRNTERLAAYRDRVFAYAHTTAYQEFKRTR